MPDFNRLHELSRKLTQLTAPNEQHPGIASWCVFVGETWNEIAEMWKSDPKRAAASEMYQALENTAKVLRRSAVNIERWSQSPRITCDHSDAMEALAGNLRETEKAICTAISKARAESQPEPALFAPCRCAHERLDENGICRQCGQDRRGI